MYLPGDAAEIVDHFYGRARSHRTALALQGSVISPKAMAKPISNMNAQVRDSYLGRFSFEADSLPDFSEFDSTSLVFEIQQEK